MRTTERHREVYVYLLIRVAKLIFFIYSLHKWVLVSMFCDCSLFQTSLEFVMKILAGYKFTQPYLLKKKQREGGRREARLTKQINIKKIRS